MRELLSRRQARENRELSDVFIYGFMPETFRNQFCHLLIDFRDRLNETDFFRGEVDDIISESILDPLSRMTGVLSLPAGRGDKPFDIMINYIQRSNDKDCIDAVDFILHVINVFTNPRYSIDNEMRTIIKEANYWLKYNNLGYEFVNDELIIKTNDTIHQQIVLPAFHLLNDPRFSGANEEMRKAYEFRRTGDNESTITEANKAFESTMKSICVIQQYLYDPHDTASKLLDVLKNNSYFPPYLNSHLDAVCASIKSGLPTVRNNNAGHGQGAQPRSVPDEYVDYALHILSTNLVFLIGLLPK